jgi:hypothetical protein
MIKRSLLFFFCLLLVMPICDAATVRNIQDNHQAAYNIIDSSGNHVTGKTVALKIKKISNGYWLDFDDDTFKNSGWVTKSVNLTEDSTESYYFYTWNPPASESAADQYLFCFDNADATYGDHQCETVEYQNIGTSTLTTSDNIGINWADISAPTTSQSLSGTTISTSQIAASVSGAVGSVTGGVTVTTNNDKTGYALSAAGIDAIWDEAIAGHLGAGSTGAKLNSAGAAGDMWSTILPGPYTAGQAGYVLSSILNSTDGDKEGSAYTGIEELIRRYGR